jgi:hypothetical protein
MEQNTDWESSNEEDIAYEASTGNTGLKSRRGCEWIRAEIGSRTRM